MGQTRYLLLFDTNPFGLALDSFITYNFFVKQCIMGRLKSPLDHQYDTLNYSWEIWLDLCVFMLPLTDQSFHKISTILQFYQIMTLKNRIRWNLGYLLLKLNHYLLPLFDEYLFYALKMHTNMWQVFLKLVTEISLWNDWSIDSYTRML